MALRSNTIVYPSHLQKIGLQGKGRENNDFFLEIDKTLTNVVGGYNASEIKKRGNKMENKYLTLAREARNENNVDDAKKYYDMARVDDPENPEAKYYAALFKVKDSANKDLPGNFVDYLTCADGIVDKVKNASMADEEKIALLGSIVKDHVSIIATVNDVIHKNSSGQTAIFDMSTYNLTVRSAATALEGMGNQIANAFGDNAEALKLAADCWKGVFLRNNWNQWYYYQSVKGNKAASAEKWEALIKKINKVDSSFTVQKPKAVQCGNK